MAGGEGDEGATTSAADEAGEHGDEMEQPSAEAEPSEEVRGEAMEVDVEDGAPRDESSMDAGPNGVAGLLAEEADDDMVADPRTDE